MDRRIRPTPAAPACAADTGRAGEHRCQLRRRNGVHRLQSRTVSFLTSSGHQWMHRVPSAVRRTNGRRPRSAQIVTTAMTHMGRMGSRSRPNKYRTSCRRPCRPYSRSTPPRRCRPTSELHRPPRHANECRPQYVVVLKPVLGRARPLPSRLDDKPPRWHMASRRPISWLTNAGQHSLSRSRHAAVATSRTLSAAPPGGPTAGHPERGAIYTRQRHAILPPDTA